MMETTPKRKRPLWVKALLALATLVIFLFSVEIFFRVKHSSPLIKPHPANPGWNHPQYLFMEDQETGYALRPYFEGEEYNRYGDFSVPVMINAWGLRDNQLNPSLCDDCFRILMLGDSFTFGEGLRWENTYPAKLEEKLRGQGLRAQVLNAGVPAYSLRHMSGRLKRYLPLVKPHLVTVLWVPWTFPREKSDMVYLNGYLVNADQKDRMKVVGHNLFFSNYPPGSSGEKLDLWLQEHSLAYFLFKTNRLWTVLPFHLIFSKAQPGTFNLPPVYLAEPMKTILGMADMCRGANSHFLLVLLESSSQNAKMIKEFGAQRNLAVISLAEEAFLPKSPYQKFIFPHDGHFNAEGANYIAESLVPVIRQLMASPPPASPQSAGENR